MKNAEAAIFSRRRGDKKSEDWEKGLKIIALGGGQLKSKIVELENYKPVGSH